MPTKPVHMENDGKALCCRSDKVQITREPNEVSCWNCKKAMYETPMVLSATSSDYYRTAPLDASAFESKPE